MFEVTSPGENPIIVRAESEIPRVQTVLEAPEALRDLLEKQTKGLKRIVVGQVAGRNTAPKVNAVTITGAKANKPTDHEALDAALLLLMRIVSAQLEMAGNALTFSFSTWHVDSTGKSERGVTRQIPFAGIYDHFTGARGDETDSSAEHYEMLRYLTAQNRHTLNILAAVVPVITAVGQTVKSQAGYSEVVVGRLSDALVREREATNAAADARAETTAINNEHEIELAKLKQRQEFMEMFGPAVQHATSQIGVDAAAKLTSGKKKKGSADAKGKNPLAMMGKKKKPKQSEPTEKPKLEIVDAELVDTEATPVPQAELDAATEVDEEERLTALMDEHPQTFSCGMLRLSLNEDQEAKVRAALGAEAWDEFNQAADASTNDETLAALVRLWKTAPTDAAAKLLGVLDGRQQGVLGTLRMAVMQFEKEHGEDS